MNPLQYPANLSHILAKSPNPGGETLMEHTYAVLHRLEDLRRIHPTLENIAQTPHVWKMLVWACFLHDMGKAAAGFQAMLAEPRKNRWGHRHEALSLVMFDWVAQSFSEEEQYGIIAAILSHHLDQKDLHKKYFLVDIDEPDPLTPMVTDLAESAAEAIWRWIADVASAQLQIPGMEEIAEPITLLPLQEAMLSLKTNGTARVRFWLERYHRWVRKLTNNMSLDQKIMPILLRGMTTTADHLASSHLAPRMPVIQGIGLEYLQRCIPEGNSPYTHQTSAIMCAASSAILIAPTGSGKTETAMAWALGDGSQIIPRIFYTLPYQASMNAMYDRLKHSKVIFTEEMIGLQHSRALQALYQQFALEGTNYKNAAARAAIEKNINRLHARPVKILSPYQMLKIPFQIKGFEAMLTDYANAACILDEVHAYEPNRLAMFVETMRFLHKSLQTRFFIMSATMPTFLQNLFQETLHISESQKIRATRALFAQFRRHRLQLCDGDLQTTGIEFIAQDYHQGKSVLACSNTIKGAQQARASLIQAGVPAENVLLIHGRYIVRDRLHKEQAITELCGINAPHHNIVVVATQVVEVSLNIDLDTIYTDPAPLEALLQRFGRVNRIGVKGVVPVHVFRQPDNGQGVYGRRKKNEEQGRIVRVTLEELEKHNGEEIDEAQIQDWLDHIYADPLIMQQWQEEYQHTSSAIQDILGKMQPFNSDGQLEDEFDELFDSVEVVPKCFEEQYLTLMAKDEYLEACQYLVSISRLKYYINKRKGKVAPTDSHQNEHSRWIINLPYDEQNGLSFDEQSHEDDVE